MIQRPSTFDFRGRIIKRVIIAKIFEGFISFPRASLKFRHSNHSLSKRLLCHHLHGVFSSSNVNYSSCRSSFVRGLVHDSRVSLTLPSSTSWFLTYFERFSISHSNHFAPILHWFALILRCLVRYCIVVRWAETLEARRWGGEREKLVVRWEESFVRELIYVLKVILNNSSNRTVVYCCVTNQPEIQWLKTTMIELYLLMILWLARQGSVRMDHLR